MPKLRSARGSSRVSPIFLGLVAATVTGGVLTLVPHPIALVGGTVLLVMAGWAVALCLHEFAHAFTADRLGDHSVRAMGYLTLDIRRYANIGLSLVLPLLFLLIGGIPLPGGAVWIQRGALRSRVAASGVSIAGPLMNFAVALVLIVAVALVEPAYPLGAALSFLALLQVMTGFLNLLPVPGLDGWGVIDPFMPARTRAVAARISSWAPLVVILALFLLPGLASLVLLGPVGDLFMAVGGDGELAAWGRDVFLSLVR